MGYDFVGLDLENNSSNPSQVRREDIAVREDELEVSQQVRREKKELHFGHGLPQAEPGSPSERHKGTGGASSTFQKAL